MGYAFLLGEEQVVCLFRTGARCGIVEVDEKG